MQINHLPGSIILQSTPYTYTLIVTISIIYLSIAIIYGTIWCIYVYLLTCVQLVFGHWCFVSTSLRWHRTRDSKIFLSLHKARLLIFDLWNVCNEKAFPWGNFDLWSFVVCFHVRYIDLCLVGMQTLRHKYDKLYCNLNWRLSEWLLLRFSSVDQVI